MDAVITRDGNPMATFQLSAPIRTPYSSHRGPISVNYGDIRNQLMIQTDGN